MLCEFLKTAGTEDVHFDDLVTDQVEPREPDPVFCDDSGDRLADMNLSVREFDQFGSAAE